MTVNKQKILEYIWAFSLGTMVSTTIYGVKLGIIPIGMFSSVILLYLIFGAVKQ